MENLPEKVPLYEMDIVKDMVGGLLGRGPAQIDIDEWREEIC